MENHNLRLIKRTESFKITITENLEKMIRFLCDKLPKNEYSGTLFYKVEGSFEKGDLHIIAKDFYLQDVGSYGYTEFNNDATMAGYMVEHGLFDCYQGLMHSHNAMPTFFSGTDTNTLLAEGNDTNHFVSLIVNNEGKYSAAITRKITKEISGDVHVKYNTFNDTPIVYNSSETTEETVIEYFMLDIVKEDVAKSELQQRLESLQKSQSSFVNKNYAPAIKLGDKFTEKPKQLVLFEDEEEEADFKAYNASFSQTKDIHFPQKLINDHVAQIITGSIFAPFNPNLDLEKWVSNMENVYSKRFKDTNCISGDDVFHLYADNMLDSLESEALDFELIEQVGDEESLSSIWAEEVASALEKYESNKYIEYYIKSLNRWIL